MNGNGDLPSSKKIKANSDSISHPVNNDLPCGFLQYADDTLIVLKGDIQGVTVLKTTLDRFASLTGLNLSKITMIPTHMAEATTQACVKALGCRREGFPQTYLGLPLPTNKLPISAYIHPIFRSLTDIWQN
jgi:hypothetical protein